MAHLLGAEALHLEFPTKVVFDGVSLGIDEGDRIGVVGRNGDGKSSLLAMLAGRLAPGVCPDAVAVQQVDDRLLQRADQTADAEAEPPQV